MERYSLSTRVIHWLMAVGFLFMWACGYAMTSVVPEDSQIEEVLFGLHISVGVSLVFLLVLRVVLRLASPHPAPLEVLSKWERIGSQLGHLALYLLPALILAIGWAEVDFGGHGASWFGVAMPKIFPTVEVLWGINLEDLSERLHRWLAYTMLVVVVVHVAAVIKHRMQGHDVLHRMMFK